MKCQKNEKKTFEFFLLIYPKRFLIEIELLRYCLFDLTKNKNFKSFEIEKIQNFFFDEFTCEFNFFLNRKLNEFFQFFLFGGKKREFFYSFNQK